MPLWLASHGFPYTVKTSDSSPDMPVYKPIHKKIMETRSEPPQKIATNPETMRAEKRWEKKTVNLVVREVFKIGNKVFLNQRGAELRFV